MVFGFSYLQLAVAVGVFIATTLGTTLLVGTFLVKIPADHFVASGPRAHRNVLLVVAKNLLGLVLIGVGIVLALPGIPGQGLLTIFVGLLLIDFPGKKRFELALVRRPALHRAINKLRARFDKPAILIE